MPEIQDIMVAGLMMSIVVICMTTLAFNFASENPDTMNRTEDNAALIYFNSSFNKYQELEETTGDLRSIISSNTSASNTDEGFFNNVFFKGWRVLENVGKSGSLMLETTGGMFAAMSSSYFGVPTWITGALVLLLTMAVIFAIIALIFKGRV